MTRSRLITFLDRAAVIPLIVADTSEASALRRWLSRRTGREAGWQSVANARPGDLGEKGRG